MKRKVILSDSYEKKITKKNNEEIKPFHRRTVSENSPNQISFKPYGRVAEKVKSIFEKDQGKPWKGYDEAQEQQSEFRNSSPKARLLNSEYKFSTLPRETTADPTTSKRKEKKNKSQTRIPHKIVNKIDPQLQNLTKSNVLVLLNKQVPKKCENCGKLKCQCEIVDQEIPEIVFQNIQKGKNLIEKARAEKKTVRTKMVIQKRNFLKTQPKSLVFESLLDELWKLPKRDANTVEGVQLVLHRRLSSEGDRKYCRPLT
jgi:hypothetical protein